MTAHVDGLNKLLAAYVERYNKQLGEKDVIIAKLVRAIEDILPQLDPDESGKLREAFDTTVCTDPDCDGIPETHWKHQHGRTAKEGK